MAAQEIEQWVERPRGYHRSPGELEAEAVEALRLKVLGWSDIDIGKRLNLTRQTVAKRVAHAVATHGQSTVAEYRELGKQRYEALIREAFEKGQDSPLEAIRIAGDLNAKLMRLVGAEAPVQVAMEVTQVTEQEKALREMLAQAERDEKARETVIVEGEVVADAN